MAGCQSNHQDSNLPPPYPSQGPLYQGQPGPDPQYTQPGYGPQYNQASYGPQCNHPGYGPQYNQPNYGPQYSQPGYGYSQPYGTPYGQREAPIGYGTAQGSYYPPNQSYEGEGDDSFFFKDNLGDFSDIHVRHAFIRKVYGLVSLMLLMCTAVTTVFMMVDDVGDYVRKNIWVFYTSWALGLGTMLVLACCGDIRRRTPHNYILLALFTVAESLMVATICCFYGTNEVVIALVITMVVTLSISLFACQTKYDFTGWAVYAWGLGWVLLLFGIVAMFWHNKIVHLVYACMGAALFVVYLLIDTQMVMGGRGVEISPEEYVFAALNLFLDVINLFLFILQIISNSRD